MDDPTSSFPASELKEKHDMSLITDDFWSKESLRDRVSQASDFVLHHTDKKIEFCLYNQSCFVSKETTGITVTRETLWSYKV